MSTAPWERTPVGRAFWIMLALLTVAGAVFLCFVSLVWHTLLGWGWLQVVVGLVGLVPAFGFLVRSVGGAERPERWVIATAAVYLVWFVALAFH